MLSRAELKTRAKESMSTASVHPVLVGLVYTVILMAVAGIVGVVFGSLTTLTALMAGMIGGSEEASIAATLATMPLSMVGSLISFTVTSILGAGFAAYALRTIRHQDAGLNTLFEYFRYFVKVFCIIFMTQLFVSLWSLLLFIPGIIAALSYQQAIYIFIDDPSKGVMQCISESKEMMRGHKGELFILGLSFILWYLLAGITCGLAAIYVTPYTALTYAVYYDNLKYIANGSPNQSMNNTSMNG